MAPRLAWIGLAACFVLLVVTGAEGQDTSDPEETAEKIADAISFGDSGELSDLSSDHIELDLGSGAMTYSRDQARYVYASFFEEHPPSRFDIGEINVLQGTCTARGTYHSLDSNQSWDAFIRLVATGSGGWSLKELRFTRSLQMRTIPQSGMPPQLPPR